MQREGLLVNCDRCGRAVFARYDEKRELERSSLVGWYLDGPRPTNVFYNYPRGDLCPACYARHRRLIEENEGKIRPVAVWHHVYADEWECTRCGNVIHTKSALDEPSAETCNSCGARMKGLKNDIL